MYVKHKIYDVYGELKNDLFFQHKWDKRNHRWVDKRTKEQRKKKHPVIMVKETVILKESKEEKTEIKLWGSRTKPYVCGEFIHYEPIKANPEDYKEITLEEYTRLVNISGNKL